MTDSTRTASNKKGRLAEDMAANFLHSRGHSVYRVTDEMRNQYCGDLWLPGRGGYVEVKGQPISLTRYRLNFAEVCEHTERADRAENFGLLCKMLRLSPERMADLVVKDETQEPVAKVRFGDSFTHLHISILTQWCADLTLYVNALEHLVFVYQRAQFADAVRQAVRAAGFVRGKGGSNRDTFAVFIERPPAEQIFTLRGDEWAADA